MSDRHKRYADFLPVGQLPGLNVAVVGVGSVGKQVAEQLAWMGVGLTHLFDPDVVSEENRGVQGWCPTEIGTGKAVAAYLRMRALSPETHVCHHEWRAEEPWQGKGDFSWGQLDAVFLCTDSRESRLAVWGCLDPSPRLLIDIRTSLRAARIITVPFFHALNTPQAQEVHRAMQEWYETTLDYRALEESCTARGTGYGATLAAALGVSRFAWWLRHQQELNAAAQRGEILPSTYDVVVTHTDAVEVVGMPSPRVKAATGQEV